MLKRTAFRGRRSNSISAFIPELWANESILVLLENMVIANRVHRKFEPIVAQYGETIHTRIPSEFVAERKTVNDDVTIQDVSATDITLKLDQLAHVSFLLRDGEESKSFKDLQAEYIKPAMVAMARQVDQVLLGQHPRFWANYAGALGTLSSTNARDRILDVRNKMNINKAYMNNRDFILAPSAETEMLKVDLFTSAEKVGDEGTALREASLGRKLGFDFFMCQNMSEVTDPATVAATTINGGNLTKGSTTLTVTSSTGMVAGHYIRIAGDGYPSRIASVTNGTTIVLAAPGLRKDIVTGAAVVAYKSNGTVGATYAAGYAKRLTLASATQLLQVGQPVSFGTATEVYTVIAVTDGGGGAATILLDRPLDATVTSGDTVNGGPAGTYNMAFHRNALALINRPLALPQGGAGALSAVVNMGGVSMRLCITYDGYKQGHLCTFDMLYGIKCLDTKLGAVLFG